MTEHEFVLTLETGANAGVEPQVRMWIDDQQSSDLASEQEVKLVRDGSAEWVAAFSARGPFLYRIGIVAAPGSRWALAFRTTGEQPEELLYDSDELTMTKEWLIGTCEEQRSRVWRREAS
ncbi:MAG TPA: hypothetical protein VMF89_28660 [Polyangiales bacterium]|nr:hypothetical protein [Polyangiales bacterium]